MPNNKSAQRRQRNSAKKQVNNRSTNSRLHSLEKKYFTSLEGGKKEEATKAFQTVISALGKAAKTGTVPKKRASRKQSRLALRLNKLK